MRKITFSKRFLAFVAFMLAAVGVNATVKVTTDANGYTVVTTETAGEISGGGLTDEQKATIKAATKLKLVGYFNSQDMGIDDNGNSQSVGFGSDALKGSVTHLDLTDAHFEPSTVTDYSSGSAVEVQKSSQTVRPWVNTLTHLYTSKYETLDIDRYIMFANFNGDLPALVEIKIDGQNISVPDNCFQGLQSLTTVEFGNINRIGNNAFQGCSYITDLDLGSVKVIGETAFGACVRLTELTIPGTVTSIETKAFTDCGKITKISFEEYDADGDGDSDVNMNIAASVFTQADHVLDVYINTEGNLTCANNCFDYATTFGHGDASAPVATLHYPSNKVEQYCNLKHPLDLETASDAAKFHVWLLAHYNAAQSPSNGWYEFVNSGPADEEEQVPSGKILKTYSFYSAPYNVTYTENGTEVTKEVIRAKIVPQGLKAYIVNSIIGVDNDEDNKVDYYNIKLKQMFAIPANTGVILYGKPNAIAQTTGNTSVSSLVMNTVSYDGDPVWRYNDTFDDVTTKNYLMPTCVDRNGTHTPDGFVITPYEPYPASADHPVTHRNFILMKYGSTDLQAKNAIDTETQDFRAFYRTKRGTIHTEKAYLHFSKEEFGLADGAEAVILKDSEYKYEYDKDGKKLSDAACETIWNGITWETPVTDWGERPEGLALGKFSGEPIFEDFEDEGIATIIIPASDSKGNGSVYYTLQGVKVVNPVSPGIYVKDGKKIVVK